MDPLYGPCLGVSLLSTHTDGVVDPLSCCGTGRREKTPRGGPSPTLVWLWDFKTGSPFPCCWDTFVPVNNGPRALVTRACGKARPDMENQRREATRPSVPSGTLELYFPDHLYRWVPAFGTTLHPDTRLPNPNLHPKWLGCRSAPLCYSSSHVPEYPSLSDSCVYSELFINPQDPLSMPSDATHTQRESPMGPFFASPTTAACMAPRSTIHGEV